MVDREGTILQSALFVKMSMYNFHGAQFNVGI